MKIALLGDIALIGRYDLTRDEEAQARVEAVRKLTQGCDVVLGNLESPLTTKEHTFVCKGVYLRGAPANVEMLKYMNVTHVTLANNHVFDYGSAGMKETKATLEANQIRYVGLGDGPVYVEKDNSRIAIEGFCCYSANGVRYGYGKNQTHLLDGATVRSFLQQAASEQAFPILSVHFGLEGVHYPSQEHVNFFRLFADESPLILHGNHPHAIQGVEKYRDSLLVYAQGDLCFGNCERTSVGQALEKAVCQSYIVIVEVTNNRITDCQTYSLTDKDSGVLHEDREGASALCQYSDALKDDFVSLRKSELTVQVLQRSPRNLKFFLQRLNLKYIGAFLNGRIHARKYKEIFNPFKR